MVVTEPVPGVVERNDEQVLPLKGVQDLRGAGRPGDRVAQRGTEPAENRGPRQELADLAWLAAEHVLGQEVDDEPVVAAELADKGPGGGVAAK